MSAKRSRKLPMPVKAPSFTLGKAAKRVSAAEPKLSAGTKMSKQQVGGPASQRLKGPA